VPIVTSAGALVDALRHLKAKRISVITPHMKPLTKMVCEYLAPEGFRIYDPLSLEVAQVGAFCWNCQSNKLLSLHSRLARVDTSTTACKSVSKESDRHSNNCANPHGGESDVNEQ